MNLSSAKGGGRAALQRRAGSPEPAETLSGRLPKAETTSQIRKSGRRGGALLAVLWLSAALAAIAFSAAQKVRAERDRTQNLVEGMQAELLATSALERGLFHILGAPLGYTGDGAPIPWREERPFIKLNFPSGEALVEAIPESSKMNVNDAQPEKLARLMLALGVPRAVAEQITIAIVDWRTPVVGAPVLPPGPTFSPPHASFQQIEELLSVSGITPDLFYGRMEHASDGRWIAVPGLRDCLSVYSGSASHDLNSVQPAVLAAEGLPPEAIAAILQLRKQGPITQEQWMAIAPSLGEMAGTLTIGGGKILTLRATARVRSANGRLGELRRTATLTVMRGPSYDKPGYRILDARSGPAERPLEETWPW
jgi:general secretion pathway protein K